jgi:hypothetical protein
MYLHYKHVKKEESQYYCNALPRYVIEHAMLATRNLVCDRKGERLK